MNVGFIGLGTMGRPMAKNLLRAGHELTVYARRPEAAAEFVSQGADQASSPAELTKAVDVVMTIVTADAELNEVVSGPGGMMEGAAEGKLLIDMSTVAPQTVRQIAMRLQEKGMRFLDAPVSGGPWGAESATLAIMIGGEAADVQRARPLLEALGKHLFHVGPIGAGQSAKLVNQLIGGGIMTLIAEGLVLGKAAGLDLEQLVDVIRSSSGNSSLLEARARKFVLAGAYAPGFRTDLMRKDVGLAVSLAKSLGVPTPVAEQALDRYATAVAAGQSELDFASVTRIYEQAAGVSIHDGSIQ